MAYKKISGIYQIQSLYKPERVYIGSATIIKERWNSHLRLLKRGKHYSDKLQRHYNKYGEGDLVFDIIECGDYLDKNHLLSREQGWYIPFEYKNTELPYFNNDKIAGSRLGSKATKETRLKQSIAKKGISLPPYAKGYKFTPEQSKRRSEQQVGEKNHQFDNHGTPETNKKKSESHKGKKHKSETIEKLRKINLERDYSPVVSNETRQKLSIANKGENNPMFGKSHSEDAKLRQREMIFLNKFIKEMELNDKNII